MSVGTVVGDPQRIAKRRTLFPAHMLSYSPAGPFNPYTTESNVFCSLIPGNVSQIRGKVHFFYITGAVDL